MLGWQANKIRSTEIHHEKGFLGPHSPILKVDDIQHMAFQESDEVPFYMNEIFQETCWHNESGGKNKKLVKNRFV